MRTQSTIRRVPATVLQSCPACGSRETKPGVVVRDHPFLRCRRCSTLFLATPPAPGALTELYLDERYFLNPAFGEPERGGYHGYKDYLADRQHIEEKFTGVLERLERVVGIGRLLDVGAGPGFLLSAARARGWDAVGVDPNEWAVRAARDDLGVEVRLGSLEEQDFAPGSFDAITLMDVIEHVPAGGVLLGIVNNLLRPKGVAAMLTPDAGSKVSRLLGKRWPEVQRVPEHLVLYSADGLTRLLRAQGFEVVDREWIGKTSSISTLVADVAPVASGVGQVVQRAVDGTRIGRRSFHLNPRTKVCLYAIKAEATETPELGERRDVGHDAEEAVLEDLRVLARARRLCAWMFDQFETPVGGRVAEIGAGIGTFSERLLARGAAELLLIEPEPASAAELDRRYADDPRVTIARERLPESPTLAARAGTIDLILCQNVLEHVERDAEAVKAMAAGLRPGGTLSLLVPAHPRLYGRLDAEYGHFRRYTRARLRAIMADAGLEVRSLYSFNLVGVAGWWLAGRRSSGRVGGARLSLYDLAVPLLRRFEEKLKPRAGLSLVAHGRKPA
jgi:2-polyprenyl-3-methyl-5-hydroxy-6-metoxy-1,4-benzoquinol methylase